MAFYLTLGQVSFPTEDLQFDASSVDSMSSVVDANVDFNSMPSMNPGDDIVRNVDESLSLDVAAEVKVTQLPNAMNATNDGNTDEDHALESSLCDPTPHSTLLSANYPEIVLPVAQYMNETNPEWCTEAEKYFRRMNESKCSPSKDNKSSTRSMVSPFRSMTATTEALALQHSVIGNQGIKPVSPDIVAQVVARTQQRLQQQKMNGDVIGNAGTNSFNECPSKQAESNQHVSTLQSFHVMKNAYLDSKVPNVLPSSQTGYQTPDNRRSSVNSITSLLSKKGMRISENDIPSVHMSQRSLKLNGSIQANKLSCDTFSDRIGDSETESCFSEKLEMESVCSDAFETESNVSEVSGFCDELFHTKRLPDECTSNAGTNINSDEQSIYDQHNRSGAATPKCVTNMCEDQCTKKEQATETDSSELFEIMRAKANLEGRLESISRNEVDLSKERSTLQSTVASLQAQLVVLTKQCEQAVSEKQNALKKLGFLNMQEGKWDNVIKDYQNAIENKNTEIKALKEDLSEAEQANIQARINCEELKVDMESREGAISGLKKKITELHVEVQILLQSKVQLQNEVKSTRHEIEMQQKSKDWYQEQLHSAQESRNKLHKDLISIQSDNVALNNQLEKSKTEIKHLQQQLGESQQRAVSEKEVLMKHLETIEADMVERESLFDEIQKDKGSVEDALLDRAKRMEEERSKLTHLMFTVSDLEYQLGVVKSDIFEKDKTIVSIEKEKAELCKQVALLQKTVNDKDLSVQQLLQNVKDANSKTAHLETTLKSVEGLNEKLKEEKNIADMSLAAANEEKCTINESLKVVKESLHRVENSFKQMKAELVTKSSKVSQLSKEKCFLEDTLKKLEDNILNQQKHFDQQMSLENQNRTVIVGDLRKQKHDIENVLEVYSSDLFGYQQRIQALEQERKDLRNEITRLTNLTAAMEGQMKNMGDDNSKLRHAVASLEKSVSQLETPENDTSSNQYPDRITAEYQHKQKVYKSNIKVLIRKLKEKTKQYENQSILIKQLKEAQNDRLVSASTEILDKNGSDQGKVLELENELQLVRSELKEETRHVEENQKIIIELEKEKGKMAATLESNSSLKSRISELEISLSEKEATVSDLLGQLKMKEADVIEHFSLNENRLADLEEDLKKEKALVKGLRQQVFQEKRANSHNHRQLASLKSGLEQANQTADSRKKDMTALQNELDAKLNSELKLRAEMEKCQTQILSQQADIKKLEKELLDVHAKDPALAQQIKSLSWHLKEKNTEIAALKEKHSLLEERHQLEVDGLKKSLQNTQSEVERCKSELDVARKQKFQYQSQLTQLRKAFRSNLIKLENSASSSVNGGLTPTATFDLNFPDPESSFDESYVNKLLQKSLEVPESRPLNHLQACLTSLKQEMAELQKQLCENAERTS